MAIADITTDLQGEWLVEEHGTAIRPAWRMLHIGLDADTGRIVAADLTTNEVDGGFQVGLLLDKVARAIASFTADGAYDTGAVSAAVAGRHPDAASGGRRAATSWSLRASAPQR